MCQSPDWNKVLACRRNYTPDELAQYAVEAATASRWTLHDLYMAALKAHTYRWDYAWGLWIEAGMLATLRKEEPNAYQEHET